jgi:Cd2+/Zn2+-exporting ATPase
MKGMPVQLKIHGLDCAEEVAVLKREIGPLVGGETHLTFDILRGRMTVDAPPAVDTGRLIAAVARTGMRAEMWTDGKAPAGPRLGLWQRHARTATTVASGLLTLGAFLIHVQLAGDVTRALGAEGLGNGHDVPFVSRVLYGLAVVIGGWFIAPKASLAARRLRPDMNLLMSAAVVGAIVIGEWFEAATVAFLFALALALESWSISRARRAVESLMELAPPMARIKDRTGAYREVPPAEVPVGSTVLVRPGEKIPLDGVVRQGHSAVNQAPITGESLPIDKDPGAAVFAGTLNGDGALEIDSTKPAEDTTLAHIIRLVSEAQGRRAPAEQWVERFARLYTPAVFALAALVILVPPLVFGAQWTEWAYRGLVLLVIGCPCALVISTPVTIVAALTSAARNGVLIKGGLFVETPARLRAIAFDKTGTLTIGHPSVSEIVALNGHASEELLQRVVSMEAHSDHPIARAIVAHGATLGVHPRPVEEFQSLQGRGATAFVDGKAYWLGSPRYAAERGQTTATVQEHVAALTRAGQTVVALGDAVHVCGLVAVADPLRSEASRTVRALREVGIDHVVMLSGDNRETAAAIGRRTKVDDVRAELLPADKVRAVEELVTTYRSVAMVGDGVNDAPAMARATVGIAMGAMGSDAAIETADIALMSDDLTKLPWLVRHSRRALSIIRQNIVLSLGVKVVFTYLTFRGQASLWAAITADMGVSLLVIFNALRLLRSSANQT